MKKLIQSSLFTAILSVMSFTVLADDAIAFQDDFNRAVVSPGGVPSMTYAITNTGSATAVMENNYLRLTCGSNITTAGQITVLGNLAAFDNTFKTTLKENTADSIIWSFNIRHNYSGNMSGFGNSGTRDVAVILCADNADITQANGYAVISGGGSYKLVKFTNGLVEKTLPTTLIEGQTLSNNRVFLSIKVVYVPATDTWKFYDREDASASGSVSDWVDPTVSTGYVQGVSVVDNTYTQTQMVSFGITGRYPTTTSAAFNIFMDNFNVTLAGVQAPASNDAALSSLKISIDGGTIYTPLMMFGADNENYTYYLTKGQEMPLVSAEKRHAAASEPVITQADNDTKKATVKVIAEDGTTEKNYEVEFVETDYVFISGLSQTSGGSVPEGWSASSMYFASSTTDGNNKYEGSNYARCLTNDTSASLTLPATKSIKTLTFYAKKAAADVTASITVKVKIGDGEWTEVPGLPPVTSLDYEEYTVDINKEATEDILVRLEITKEAGTVAYYFDDFAYTFQLSSNADLSVIKVSTDAGAVYEPLMMFSADVEKYEYYLTKEQIMPLVSAEKLHPSANEPVVTQATSETKKAIIEVTAQDGETQKDYEVEFIETDYVFISGLSQTENGETPEGWTAENMYFENSTTDGNNKYEGSNYAYCQSDETSASLTLPALKSIGTLTFFAKKVADEVIASVTVKVKTGDGEWTEIPGLPAITSTEYQEYSIVINKESEVEDILVQLVITKEAGTTAYNFDDFVYTANTVTVGMPEKTNIPYTIVTEGSSFTLSVDEAKLQVYSLDGKLVKQTNVEGTETIQLNHTGMYLVKIHIGNDVYQSKLILK